MYKTYFTLFSIIILISCSFKGKSQVKVDTENRILKQMLNKKDEITGSFQQEEIYATYKKNDFKYWIEGSEINDENKVIYYTVSHFNNINCRNDLNYTFIEVFDKKKLVLIKSEIFNCNNPKNNSILSTDTLYTEKNKIKFWKNKNPSKEEILSKEKEILAIRREIDSILEN